MVSNSKARESTTLESMVVQNRTDISLLRALIRDREGFTSTESRSIGLAGGTTQSGIEGFLKTAGDTMVGPLAYLPRIGFLNTEDSSIDVSQEKGDNFTSHIQLAVGVSIVNLDWIHGALHAGQQLEIQGILSESFVIRESVDDAMSAVGNGSNSIITVTADTTKLATGEYVSIVGAGEFTIPLAKITVLNGTTFTYDLGTVGSTTPDNGFYFRGNIRTHLGEDITVVDNQLYGLTYDSATSEWVIKGAESIAGENGGGVSNLSGLEIDVNKDWEALGISNVGPLTGVTSIEFTTLNHKITSGTDSVDFIDISVPGGTDEIRFSIGGAIQYRMTPFHLDFSGNKMFGIGNIDPLSGSTPSIGDSGNPFGFLHVREIDMDGVNAKIHGVQTLEFITDNTSIVDGTNGLIYQVDDLKEHLFRTPNGDFLALIEDNATDRKIDAKQNRVTNVGKLSFTPTTDADTAITSQIYETLTDQDLRYVSKNSHDFVINGSVIFQINDALGLQIFGQHTLDMNNNIINATREITFSDANSFNPIDTSIGYDNVAKTLIYNTALTDSFHSFKINNELMATLSRVTTNQGLLTIANITTDTIGVNDLLDFSTFDNTTPANGNVWLNPSGVFQFRENGITVGLGNVSANKTLSNLEDVVRPNKNILADRNNAGNLGADNVTDAFRDVFVDKTTFVNDHVLINGKYEIAKIGGHLAFNIPNGSDFHWFINNILEMELDSANLKLSNVNLDMLSHSITNVSFLESNTVNRSGSGFIRMAQADQIRMRNPDNNDDLIIQSGDDALNNQSILFQVAGGDRVTISQFDMDLKSNDIINTGDVLPQGTGEEVGDATNFYNQMHSQFFIPEGASIFNSRYGLSKTGNTLYVNFDDTNIDAGFGIYEQGVQRFLFSRTGTTPFVNEFFIGGDPFLSGETYRIQMGENSTSSAFISFTEGANDLILERAGIGTTRSVDLRTGGLSRFITNSVESKFFSDVNVNSQDITNTKNIFADGTETATIGELITNNGGFDYYVRDKIFWDGDPDTFIQLHTDGIDIISDDAINISALETNGFITIQTNLALILASASNVVAISGFTQASIAVNPTGGSLDISQTRSRFSGAPVVLDGSADSLEFQTAISGSSIAGTAGDNIKVFNDSDTGKLSVIKSTGGAISLEDVNVDTLTTKGDLFGFDTSNARIPVGTDGQVLTANSAVSLGVEWQAPSGGSGTSFIGFTADANLDMGNLDIESLNNILFDNGWNQTGTLATPLIFNHPTNPLEIFKIQIIGDDRITVNAGRITLNALDDHLEFRENGILVGLFDETLNAPSGQWSLLRDLKMNLNQIINMGDPILDQDAVTKAYGDANYLGGGESIDGIQDVKLSLDHETQEYDFEIWLSNAKHGSTDFATTDPVYQPILVNTQYYLPIYIGKRSQVLRVGVDVGLPDFDDMAMAIYDSHPLQNYPNQRVSNVVTGFINSTGILDLFFAQNLEAGLYFFSIWIDGNAESTTFLYHPASSANCIGWRPEDGDSGKMLPINGFIEVGVTQSLPSFAPDDMVSLPQEIPAIFAKLIPNTS